MNIGMIICGIKGHSKKVDRHMGLITCNRCGELLMDTLTQAADPKWLKTLTYITGDPEDAERTYQKIMKEALSA